MDKAIKKGTTDIVPHEQSTEIIPQEQNLATINTETLISQAINSNVPVETMERLLALAERMQAIKAKQEFDKAMANFQAECPTIVKTKGVKTKSGVVAYKYAPIESIVEQVKPYLKSNGFSYSTSMEVLQDGVKVICKVTHVMGHSEESPMQVPLGTKTDIMSQSQVTAAAQTFAKRYAFCNAFGILTGDEDTDARPQEEPTYSYEAQIQKPFDDNNVLKMILADLENCDTAEEYTLRSSDIKIARANGKLSDASFKKVKEACAVTVKRIQGNGLKEVEPKSEAALAMERGMAKTKQLTK